LQISEFIKDPTTLKLLILAGTNIKSSELSTVAKCTNLIKLDLSSNMLSDIPITFSHFVQLKILYLHDNNIFSLSVANPTVEYITLFNNPFKGYRKDLLKTNKNLLALDYNIVTPSEKITLKDPAPFT
jgi:Leucine-rich repeat (LRR) protein